MKKMHTTFLVVALLVAFSFAESQELQQIADNVYVISLADRQGTVARNIGVVEFDDHLLVIDVCEGVSLETLTETLRGVTPKPVRYLARTHGSAAVDCDADVSGITHLVPGGTDLAEVQAGKTMLPTDVVLSDGAIRVVLHSVSANGEGSGWTLLVGDSNVLFAGDLVGPANGGDQLPTEEWITALLRAEQARPDMVVPGRGPLDDADLLRTTRDALVNARARIVEMVNDGSARPQIVESVDSDWHEVLPERTIEFLYDEYVGVVPATAFVETLGLREGPSPTAASSGWTRPRKVVVADLWPGRTQQLALAAPGVELLVAGDREQAADLVEDADAILGWLTPEILERGVRLRWVSLFSAGVESYLALPGFRESEVVLTNGQSLYANGGAEHVLGMVLALSRRLPTALHLQSERRWDTQPLTGPTPITGGGSELGELRGKTLLVVGLGGIGTEVARLAHGIGMRVIATRASRREGPSFVEYVGLSSELFSLVPDADVIVNCVPLTTDTERMFDDTVFSLMKSSAFFVNIGRGKTVDTDALVRALRDGGIAGAGLDVTEPEPLPSDHELWSLPNVIITPHVGGDSEAHMERIWLLFRENLRRFAVGESLLSVVNKSRGY